jgi:hypothetical protein
MFGIGRHQGERRGWAFPASAKSQPKRFYACTNHHKRGDTVCTNAARLRYDDITKAVIKCFGPDFQSRETLTAFLKSPVVTMAEVLLSGECGVHGYRVSIRG